MARIIIFIAIFFIFNPIKGYGISDIEINGMSYIKKHRRAVTACQYN